MGGTPANSSAGKPRKLPPPATAFNVPPKIPATKRKMARSRFKNNVYHKPHFGNPTLSPGQPLASGIHGLGLSPVCSGGRLLLAGEAIPDFAAEVLNLVRDIASCLFSAGGSQEHPQTDADADSDEQRRSCAQNRAIFAAKRIGGAADPVRR